MSDPRRYLRNMTIFVGLVVLICVPLVVPLRDAFFANVLLNGFIIAVLVFGVGYVFRQVTRLRPEIAWVESYKRAESSTAAVADEPQLLAPMAAMLGGDRGPSKLSALSTRSLLDSIAARLEEAREVSRYLIGLLIFLGLLGTFWGLLKTIGAIGDTIQSLSIGGNDLTLMFDDLKRGLETPLSGMATAFSSSLFGLGGSVIVGFLDLQAGQAQNRFFTELEDWLSTETRLGRAEAFAAEGGGGTVSSYVSALLEQSAESLDAMQRIFAKSDEGRRDANEALIALSEHTAALADQMKISQQLMAKLAEGQTELRQTLQKLAGAAGGGGLDEAAAGHLRNIDVHLRQMLQEQGEARQEISEEIRAELKLLARTIGAAVDASRRGPGTTNG